MRHIIIALVLFAAMVSATIAQVPDFTKVFTNAALVSGSIVAPKLGSIFYIQDEDKAYKFVKNTGVVTTAGDVVVFSVTNGVTQNALYEVTKPVTANLNLMAGVAMGAIPATNGQGWIQIYGHHAAINMEGTTDIGLGDSLKCTDGQFYVIKDQAIGTEPTYASHIIAFEAYTTNSAATKEGFIRCFR